MIRLVLSATVALALSAPALAQSVDAVNFGKRPEIEQVSLSPDGTRVAFLAPGPGSGVLAFVASVDGGTPKQILHSDGKPSRLQSCRWVSNARLACRFTMLEMIDGVPVPFSRMIAVNADGSDMKMLSARTGWNAKGFAQGGGSIIDWSGGQDGSVLMTRTFVPESATDTRLVDKSDGYGVERVDVKTMRRSTVERPRRDAAEYISDGEGNVRILGTIAEGSLGYSQTTIRYFYRRSGSEAWEPLSDYDRTTGRGFNPLAVDRALNVVYGFDRLEGRQALYKIALDGSHKRELVFSHPQVDVDGLIRLGRQGRVVGTSFATERRAREFFDPSLKRLAASLGKALPHLPLVQFVDASLDGSKLLLWAGSDVDPGRYYLFDQTTKKLGEIMLVRPELEKAVLAPVKAVRFPAADGTMIPGYLTLPAGGSGKNLPAIVMPHGGPGARDEWEFDWLAQFFAARGFAVLQPNFRGSAGYGEGWFEKNGFQSWRTAIGDINDGGRWLAAQGIAAPDKLAIVGWSYGGYAALQSSVLDPALFKAIVAVAPVTDLGTLRDEARRFLNYRLVDSFIGEGPHVREGSPAQNAAAIRAPVLMFHGTVDLNVNSRHSRLMRDRLRDAGKQVEYVEFADLDHQLPDSKARTELLDRSDRFLRAAMGLPAVP